MSRQISFNPNGKMLHVLVFRYLEKTTGTTGKFQTGSEEEFDISTLDYNKIEQAISEELATKKGFLFGNNPFDVQVYAFTKEEHVQASGLVDESEVVLSGAVSTSPMHFVGGRILERHEVLKALGGELEHLKKFPSESKGVTTIIPKTIFPFIEGHNVHIERQTSAIFTG